jgi:hypothetical protein
MLLKDLSRIFRRFLKDSCPLHQATPLVECQNKRGNQAQPNRIWGFLLLPCSIIDHAPQIGDKLEPALGALLVVHRVERKLRDILDVIHDQIRPYILYRRQSHYDRNEERTKDKEKRV